MLDDIFQVYYNGVTFPTYSVTQVTMRPVFDRARRRVLYLQYVVSVQSHVTVDPDDDTNNTLEQYRQLLSQRGGVLRIKNKGLGDFSVNDLLFQGPRDVACGPHPTVIEWKPIGHQNAALVSWTCEANVPECAEGTAVTQGRPMEFVYTWAVTTDEHGFSTRSVSGQLTIPMTILTGERVPPDAADRYWDDVIRGIPPVPSSKRSVQRTLSEDRRTINFSITDRECPANAFVPGVTEFDAYHDLSSDFRANGFVRWTNTIRATYSVARDRPKRDAYEHFLALVKSRTDRTTNRNASADWYVTSLAVNDHASGQDVTFNLQYILVSNLRMALAASGMWLPIPFADWDRWATSVAETALHGRGNSRLAYDPASDSLIDLCDPPVFELRPGNARGLNVAGDIDERFDNRTLRGGLPRPDRSWIAYECRLIYDSEEGFHTLRTLPLDFTPAAPVPATAPVVGFDLQAGGQPSDIFAPFGNIPDVRVARISVVADVIPPQPAEQPPSVVQRRSSADPMVRVVGRAMRVGYQITPPVLLGAAGALATLVRPRFAHQTMAAAGVPILGACWDYTYKLDRAANGQLPVPSNPVLGT